VWINAVDRQWNLNGGRRNEALSFGIATNMRMMFTKLDLIERIIAIEDPTVLEKVGRIMVDEQKKGPMLNASELAELDARWADYKRGMGTNFSIGELDALMKRQLKKP